MVSKNDLKHAKLLAAPDLSTVQWKKTKLATGMFMPMSNNRKWSRFAELLVRSSRVLVENLRLIWDGIKWVGVVRSNHETWTTMNVIYWEQVNQNILPVDGQLQEEKDPMESGHSWVFFIQFRLKLQTDYYSFIVCGYYQPNSVGIMWTVFQRDF